MTQNHSILLVDDNVDDVELAMKAFSKTKLADYIYVVSDGIEAMQYLRNEGKYVDAARPSLVLIDLNMPRKDGREVLFEMKADPKLRKLPVVVLTTSQTEEDIERVYDLHANCFITKPMDQSQLTALAHLLDAFWFEAVQLPKKRM